MNNDFIHDITKALNSITKSKNAEEWEIDIDENIDDFVINHIIRLWGRYELEKPTANLIDTCEYITKNRFYMGIVKRKELIAATSSSKTPSASSKKTPQYLQKKNSRGRKPKFTAALQKD